MTNYLLAHGFGFTNDYWQNLVPLLDGNIYFFDDLDLDKDKTYVGIGHSVGFLKLNNSGLQFDALIALQGFLNFCGSSDRMRKIREAGIAKVRNRVLINKHESLHQFRTFCGYDKKVITDIPLQTLLDELEMMGKGYAHCGVKTLVIGSADDVIVPMSIINDNFSHLSNAIILQVDYAKHALGYIKTQIVAEKIQKINTILSRIHKNQIR